jgi:hypothetical protein
MTILCVKEPLGQAKFELCANHARQGDQDAAADPPGVFAALRAPMALTLLKNALPKKRFADGSKHARQHPSLEVFVLANDDDVYVGRSIGPPLRV